MVDISKIRVRLEYLHKRYGPEFTVKKKRWFSTIYSPKICIVKYNNGYSVTIEHKDKFNDGLYKLIIVGDRYHIYRRIFYTWYNETNKSDHETLDYILTSIDISYRERI